MRDAPETKVELGGAERTLRFDLGAVWDFEEFTGLNLLDPSTWVTDADAKTVTEEQLEAMVRREFGRPKVLASLICAMLRHEDESLQPRQVARWIHPGNMDQMLSVSFGVYAGGLPDAPEPSEGGDDTEEGGSSEDPPAGPPTS